MRSRAEEISAAALKDYKKSREKRWEPDANEIPDTLRPEAVVDLAKSWEKQFLEPNSIRERKVNLKQWTSDAIKDLKEGCRIEALNDTELSICYRHTLRVPAKAEALSVLLKAVALLLVFSDPRVKTVEAKGAMVIRDLSRLSIKMSRCYLGIGKR
jgi:dGTP triphosphohydrolase